LDKSSYKEQISDLQIDKVKITANENMKIVFCSYFRQVWIWIDYVKPNSKWSAAPASYHRI